MYFSEAQLHLARSYVCAVRYIDTLPWYAHTKEKICCCQQAQKPVLIFHHFPLSSLTTIYQKLFEWQLQTSVCLDPGLHTQAWMTARQIALLTAPHFICLKSV